MTGRWERSANASEEPSGARELADRMKAAVDGAEVTVRASVEVTYVAPGDDVHAGEALSRAGQDTYATERATRL